MKRFRDTKTAEATELLSARSRLAFKGFTNESRSVEGLEGWRIETVFTRIRIQLLINEKEKKVTEVWY